MTMTVYLVAAVVLFICARLELCFQVQNSVAKDIEDALNVSYANGIAPPWREWYEIAERPLIQDALDIRKWSKEAIYPVRPWEGVL